MQIPTSRNVDFYENGKDYDFMGLNAGGPGTVQTKIFGGIYIYPDTVENSELRHGMCGDSKTDIEKYNNPNQNYPILNTFLKGTDIDIEIIVTAHHMGHFEFYICDMFEKNVVTQECLFQNRLNRVHIEGEISPVDENYPYRYYLESRDEMIFQTDGYPGYVAKMKYKLPNDLTCEHCVLQWWYYTANSCIYEGYNEYTGMTNWYNKNLGMCTNPGLYPEEFWNCADIRIVDNVPSPVPTLSPTLPPPPVPEPTPPPGAPTSIPTVEPTVPSPECKSISPQVTDLWCQAVNCDPVYKDFCTTVATPSPTPTASPAPTATPSPTPTASPAPTATPAKEKVIVGYYTSWSIYARNFLVTDIQMDKITHLNYAFANLDENGNVLVGDIWADTQFVYPDEQSPGTGNFGALQRIKKSHPELKTLISIGGWTWSSHFSTVVSNAQKRAKFVETSIQFMLEYGFDGIDIDWEFPVEGGPQPGTESDTENFTLLLQELREKINELNDEYLITLATTQNINRVNYIEISKINDLVDFINIMTYDYNGPWNNNLPTNHNAPLYQNKNDPSTSASIFNIFHTLEYYQNENMSKEKIVVGLPFYGYYYGGVEDTNNGLFQSWKIVPKGTWSNGILDYDDIRDNFLTSGDWEYHFDEYSKVPYLYSKIMKQFISYDDTTSISLKSSYVCQENFHGVMLWDLSSDRDADLLTVINTVFSQY